MKTTTAALAAFVSAGMILTAGAQMTQQPGEEVDLSSLPASVQETIKQKAAGGEVIRVKREDDADGKWNYEVAIQTNGKESGFEVDPNGKLLREQTEIRR